MALAPWNVLAGGKFRTDAEEEQRRATGEHGRKVFDPSWERNEVEKKVSSLLERVAKEVGTKSLTAGKYAQQGSGRHRLIFSPRLFVVAIAYVMQKNTLRFPHYWRAQG